MHTAYGLVLISSFLYCVAPVVYILGVHRREIIPNPASWFIWGWLGSCNAVFYYLYAPEQEKFLAFLSVLSAGCMLVVFFYTRYKHSFGVMRWAEWTSIVLLVMVMVIWVMIRKNEHAEGYASALIQLPMLIAFVPTCMGLIRKDGQEKPWAWFFGGLAYLFQIAALALSPEQDWTRYVWPVLNGIIGNGSVLLCIALQERRKK